MKVSKTILMLLFAHSDQEINSSGAIKMMNTVRDDTLVSENTSDKKSFNTIY
jgi:hypothetical protein